MSDGNDKPGFMRSFLGHALEIAAIPRGAPSLDAAFLLEEVDRGALAAGMEELASANAPLRVLPFVLDAAVVGEPEAWRPVGGCGLDTGGKLWIRGVQEHRCLWDGVLDPWEDAGILLLRRTPERADAVLLCRTGRLVAGLMRPDLDDALEKLREIPWGTGGGVAELVLGSRHPGVVEALALHSGRPTTYVTFSALDDRRVLDPRDIFLRLHRERLVIEVDKGRFWVGVHSARRPECARLLHALDDRSPIGVERFAVEVTDRSPDKPEQAMSEVRTRLLGPRGVVAELERRALAEPGRDQGQLVLWPRIQGLVPRRTGAQLSLDRSLVPEPVSIVHEAGDDTTTHELLHLLDRCWAGGKHNEYAEIAWAALPVSDAPEPLLSWIGYFQKLGENKGDIGHVPLPEGPAPACCPNLRALLEGRTPPVHLGLPVPPGGSGPPAQEPEQERGPTVFVLVGLGDLFVEKLAPLLRDLEPKYDTPQVFETVLVDVLPMNILDERWGDRAEALDRPWIERRFLHTPPDADATQLIETRLNEIKGRLRDEGRLEGRVRIAAMVAIPPVHYPRALQTLAPLAARAPLTVALEKPLAADSAELEELKATVLALGRDYPGLKVAAIDHYTQRWALRLIERRRRGQDGGLVGRLLAGAERATVRSLEAGVVPPGRRDFYDGVGATLDMSVHLLAVLLTLCGWLPAPSDLKSVHLAQLEDSGLKPDTETFFRLSFHSSREERGRQVALVSGKGLNEDDKCVRLECAGGSLRATLASRGGNTVTICLGDLAPEMQYHNPLPDGSYPLVIERLQHHDPPGPLEFQQVVQVNDFVFQLIKRDPFRERKDAGLPTYAKGSTLEAILESTR
ncbi:MAG: hypothetical protein ABIO70_27030 [Pseudomonadota bacterium]